MIGEHADAVEVSFSSQAAAFEDPRFNRVFATDIDWLFEHLARKPDDLVLDVAGGTGHAARCPAPSVAGEITRALRAEIDGGQRTGLRPREQDDGLWFAQRFASVTARKPS